AAPPAVDLLARLAGDPRNQSLARRAVVALGRTGAPQAIPVLLDLLGKARDDRERLAIVEALGNLRATEAADVLAELADGASDPRLRITAVIALGTIRDGGSLPVLTRLLDDPLPAVRLTTIRALAALGDPRATASIAALVRREADALAKRDDVALFADPSTALAGLAVQLDGLRTLADLDAPAAVDAILAATTRRKLPADSATALRLAEGFYEVRRQAIYALGYTKSDRAKAYLAGPEGLGDPDPRIRLVAVRARGVLGGSGALAEITPHLDDPSTDVRRMAAIVAGRLGDAAAVPLLVKALEDPIPQVRREAALGLAFLDAAEAREALARTAQSDSDEEVKAAARFALKRLDKPGSVE
ncbi:MAG: HEAT repeat domain-containing protein, partial [Hyphomicrobiales bacterium]|nr:HEAT repeat domain-containing protein [Hyphomicrobiales bacterium]